MRKMSKEGGREKGGVSLQSIGGWLKDTTAIALTLKERFDRLEVNIERLVERQRRIDEEVYSLKGTMSGYPDVLSAKLERAIAEIELRYFERLKELEKQMEDFEKRLDGK